MAYRKRIADPPEVLDAATGKPEPTPRLNLHDLDAVRREMGKVYRDMKQHRIDCQDGTRLVYVLTQIAKVIELADLERRLAALEGVSNGKPGIAHRAAGSALEAVE